MHVVMLGAPGAGKGTQASILSKELALRHIASGDLFRQALEKRTNIGLLAKGYMDKGELVPDELTIELVKDRLTQDDVKNGFMLDGFPRTITQAEALTENIQIDIVLSFLCPDSIVIERLSGRRVCKNCGEIFHIKNIPPKKEGICDKSRESLIQRKDDTIPDIKERLQIFGKQTRPLMRYYESKVPFINITCDDIDMPPEEAIEQIMEELKKQNLTRRPRSG